VCGQPSGTVPDPERMWYGLGAIPPKPLHGDACHSSDQGVGALRSSNRRVEPLTRSMDPSRSVVGTSSRGALGRL
jgi:hypothetical protein